MAARPDAHARVRIRGRLPRRPRAPATRLRRRALEPAQVPADGLHIPCGCRRPRRQARTTARALPQPARLGLTRAPRDGHPDPRLPLGRGDRAKTRLLVHARESMPYLTETWFDPRLTTGPSKVHGTGLFAAGPIAAGEVVM